MKIVNHIGANCTDDDRLLGSLRKNSERFGKIGTQIPAPSSYRRLLRETLQGLKGQAPSADAREILLDEILDGATADRVIFSNSKFICVPKRIFERKTFYHLAEEKLGGMRQLFAEDEREICLALRNPAAFVPACFNDAGGGDFDEFMRGVDPLSLRWSDVIRDIQRIDPEACLTVWCDEDTPLIWPRLIRALANVSAAAPISGGYDLLAEIMSPVGMSRFLTYVKSHPPQTEQQKCRVIEAFLEKFAVPELLAQEVSVPGWTHGLIEALTERYEEDVAAIAQMDGITFIAPPEG